MIRPVILSGGSGTRLWPLSTPALPKQFAGIIPGEPNLFEATLRRLDGVPGVVAPTIVTGADHVDLVTEVMAATGRTAGILIVEPLGRNTGPAVAAAALAADASDILVILPSDHLIRDSDQFRVHVGEAVGHAESGSIVTFGVFPDRAETGYGYIETGEAINGAATVARFKEKPSPDDAAGMVSDGRHLWNSGMFVTGAGTVIDEMAVLCPSLLDGVRSAFTAPSGGTVMLGTAFADVDSISFDHAVMEKTSRAVVVPIDVAWDDIGSFAALHGRLSQDRDRNATWGDVVLDEVAGSIILATSRTVAVAGLEGIIVVETPDAVLVVPLDEAQRVRGLAERARKT